MKNLGKPNMSGGVKTGFKLMGKTVPRGARPQKPSVKGTIATNHPITAVRGVMGKARGKKMY
jgi:hypothetical protein